MHSTFSSEALQDFVNTHYDVGSVVGCRLLTRGLNDTYRVDTERGRFVLRVYRTPWRSRTEVDYELDVLTYLNDCNIPVSAPVKNCAGTFTTEIAALEGTRLMTLFTYAKGSIPRLDPEISAEYGRTVAKIHQATDNFSSHYRRFNLDFQHLLYEPLERIRPTMTQYGGDVTYIESWIKTITAHVSIELLDFGFCHGDFHDWNTHLDEGILTVFDFDCCGKGFRAYDLAVFLWNLKTNYKGKETENWSSFLEGYREVRPLSEADLNAIPFFVAARRIWLAWIYLTNEDVWGTAIVNERFFQSFVDQLQEDERELGIPLTGLS